MQKKRNTGQLTIARFANIGRFQGFIDCLEIRWCHCAIVEHENAFVRISQILYCIAVDAESAKELSFF